MKRAGFTMIELIFVIVILGILASVAVPKLLGVKDSAEEGLLKSFVGSLNTTTAPAKWSQSLMDGNSGALINATTPTLYDITTSDTDMPAGITLIDVSACGTTTSVASTVLGSKTFYVVCRDGSSTAAPRFWYTEINPATTAAVYDDTKLKLP